MVMWLIVAIHIQFFVCNSLHLLATNKSNEVLDKLAKVLCNK